MRTLYRERRYECGDYLEVDIFPVFRVASAGKRKQKAKPSSESQEILNQHNAERKLIRLLNANFTEEDYEIHLTYRDENMPMDDESAKKDVRNFLRRVKRKREAKGLSELKYISVTEGGVGGTRYHHHITLSGGLTRAELEECWSFGYANSRRLEFSENGVEGLARYITKQFHGEKGALLFKKRWNASKNLIRPEAKDRDGKISARRAKELVTEQSENLAVFSELYPGYICSAVRPIHNQYNGGYYLCLRLYREDSAFLRRKQKKDRGRKVHG